MKIGGFYINRLFWMFGVVLGVLIVSFSLFFVKMPSVQADELSDKNFMGEDDSEDDDSEDDDFEEDYPYSLTYEFVSDQGIENNPYYIQSAILRSKNPLFIYLMSEGDNARYYRVGAFDGEKCGAVLSSKAYDTVVVYYMKYTMDRKDDSVKGSTGTDINPDYNYLTDATYIPVYGNRDFVSDALVFDSLESAEAFYLTGNKDGVIYEPEEDDTTVDLNTLYLTGVKLNTNMLGFYSITWTGTSLDDQLLDVPDSDTLIVPSMILYDKSSLASTAIPFFKNTDLTFSDHKLSFNMMDFYDYATFDESKLATAEVYLSPCYTKDGKLYCGRTTVVNVLNGEIRQEYIDDDDDFQIEDVTPVPDPGGGGSGDSFSFSDISEYINKFFSFLKSLINSMGSLPSLFATVFSFLPSIYVNAIGVIFILILILRVLGR